MLKVVKDWLKIMHFKAARKGHAIPRGNAIAEGGTKCIRPGSGSCSLLGNLPICGAKG